MTAQRKRSGLLIHLAAFAALLLLLYPLFFVLYRVMVFNTMPRDDYAPFVMWLAGAPGGAYPGSPYGYRLLTMLAALPFYAMLPPIRFSNLPADLTTPYLKATAAIAALSYVSCIVAAMLAYRTARDRLRLPRPEAAIAGVLIFVLCWHSQVFGVDAVSIMLVGWAVYVLPKPGWFAAIMLISVGCNEKVPIVAAIWLTIRVALVLRDRERLRLQWLAAITAVAVYGLLLTAVQLPGNEYQLMPAGYFATLATNLRATLSGRGLLLNVLPTLILGAIALLAWMPRDARAGGIFYPVDGLVIPGLVLLSLVLTQQFQMGRIVMHAAPLFVVPAAATLGRWSRQPPS